jgi:hypothetical protein
MAMIYTMQRGVTESVLMSLDYDSGLATIQYFNAGGVEFVPTGSATISVSPTQTGENFKQVQPSASGQWYFNGPAARMRISLAGTNATTAIVTIWRGDDSNSGIPSGAFSGDRAMTIQGYDEANKKRGVQWEASRLITITSNAPANNVFSIIKTGSKPVDLKTRVFGYDGIGVIGRIYKAPVYTGGTADPLFNMNPRYLGTQPEVQVLTGFTLTSNGTKCGADIFAIGPASNQSRGATPREFGSNRILDEPNTSYLLEIESRDSASQIVMARIELYEGGLDLPLK